MPQKQYYYRNNETQVVSEDFYYPEAHDIFMKYASKNFTEVKKVYMNKNDDYEVFYLTDEELSSKKKEGYELVERKFAEQNSAALVSDRMLLKTSSDFKYLLNRIKKDNYGSTMNTEGL